MNISLSEFDFYSQNIDLDLTHFVMTGLFKSDYYHNHRMVESG